MGLRQYFKNSWAEAQTPEAQAAFMESYNNRKRTAEGVKRAGRISLWAVPPVGLWRSVRHGKKQHEKRLAKEIAKELRRGKDA